MPSRLRAISSMIAKPRPIDCTPLRVGSAAASPASATRARAAPPLAGFRLGRAVTWSASSRNPRFCGCDNAIGTLTISVTDRQYRATGPGRSVSMKAAPFEYTRAADIDEACAWLAADDGARVIAGGQTLVPMMAMRLARPTRLIDINRIAALSYIRAAGEAVAIGATTRQCLVERDALVAAKVPLLARAIPNIGHAATRARGTIGGSLANADPAAEISLVAVTLDATLSYRAGGKTTDIPARGFHVGAMVTSLPEGACLTSVRFPVW